MLNYLNLNGTSNARNCEQSQDSYEHTLLRETGICITGYEIKINIREHSVLFEVAHELQGLNGNLPRNAKMGK